MLSMNLKRYDSGLTMVGLLLAFLPRTPAAAAMLAWAALYSLSPVWLLRYEL